MKRDQLINLLYKLDPDADVVIPVYEGFGYGGYPIVCARGIESVESLKDDGVNQIRIYYEAYDNELDPNV